MSYNREIFATVKRELNEKRKKAQDDADAKKEELYASIPQLREIDLSLSRTGTKMLGAAIENIGNKTAFELAADNVRAETEELRKKRADLLVGAGYAADCTEPRYSCVTCGDTGYVDGKMCDCLRSALTFASFDASGIGRLLRKQSFENFSLDYYKYDKITYENALFVRDFLLNFANTFTSSTATDILLMGTTGLGKTHLSSAVARKVIERGCDAVYAPVGELISVFERDRFKSGDDEENLRVMDSYYSSDLLIIDDLGTEVTNNFSLSCLYNVINTRLNHSKSTMINTNLDKNELRARYSDRITSRIFGEYTVLLLTGKDNRLQKIIARGQ